MFLKRTKAAVVSVGVLAFLMIMAGGIACKKAGQTETPAASAPAAGAQEGTTLKEGLNDVSGTVKSALGKYFYISQHPGFDIVASGQVDAGDASLLLDKEVRAKVVFNPATPAVLVAQNIELKEGESQYRSVFSSSDTSIPADYLDQKARGEFAELKITNINKSEDWEGKGKGKIFGKLVSGAGGQGQAVSLMDDKGKEIANVIIDNMTEYARYYVKKLRLFDSFWFYLNIKDSVDKKLRVKNKEIFHAEVVFAGLY
jgi:hypothetical protein